METEVKIVFESAHFEQQDHDDLLYMIANHLHKEVVVTEEKTARRRGETVWRTTAVINGTGSESNL